MSDIFKPKRYALGMADHDHNSHLDEWPNGEWVAWSDYETLLTELRAEQQRYDEFRMRHRNCDPRGLVFDSPPRVITRVMDDGVETKDGAA